MGRDVIRLQRSFPVCLKPRLKCTLPNHSPVDFISADKVAAGFCHVNSLQLRARKTQSIYPVCPGVHSIIIDVEPSIDEAVTVF